MVKYGYDMIYSTLGALFAKKLDGTSLPGVLEIVSCHNSMCEKEEHKPFILKIMLTPEWNWKMSVLRHKSPTYLKSESKGYF